MIDNQYRTAFSSFVQNGSIGPFASKRQLSGEEVKQELAAFQESRERYESFDQGDHDKNREPGYVKVATETAFPQPAPPAEYAEFVGRLDEAMDSLDMKPDTSNDFLNVKLEDNQIEVEESGTRSGVSFTRNEGQDTYYLNVSFDGQTDVVQAIHVNSASGTGSIQELTYLVPDEEPKQPEGTLLKSLDGGASIRADEDGIIRFDFG